MCAGTRAQRRYPLGGLPLMRHDARPSTPAVRACPVAARHAERRHVEKLRPTIRGHVSEVRRSAAPVCAHSLGAWVAFRHLAAWEAANLVRLLGNPLATRPGPQLPASKKERKAQNIKTETKMGRKKLFASQPSVSPHALVQLLDAMQRASKPVNLHEAFSLPVAFKARRCEGV